jgi:hypothetical protein
MGNIANALQQRRAERREAQSHVEKLDQARCGLWKAGRYEKRGIKVIGLNRFAVRIRSTFSS